MLALCQSACDFSAVNASLDWSTIFPELTDVEWSYTRSFGEVPQALLTPPELLVLDLKRNNLSSISHLDFAAAGNLEQLDISHNSIDGTVPGGLAEDTFITVVELGFVFGLSMLRVLPPRRLNFQRLCARSRD